MNENLTIREKLLGAYHPEVLIEGFAKLGEETAIHYALLTDSVAVFCKQMQGEGSEQIETMEIPYTRLHKLYFEEGKMFMHIDKDLYSFEIAAADADMRNFCKRFKQLKAAAPVGDGGDVFGYVSGNTEKLSRKAISGVLKAKKQEETEKCECTETCECDLGACDCNETRECVEEACECEKHEESCVAEQCECHDDKTCEAKEVPCTEDKDAEPEKELQNEEKEELKEEFERVTAGIPPKTEETVAEIFEDIQGTKTETPVDPKVTSRVISKEELKEAAKQEKAERKALDKQQKHNEKIRKTLEKQTTKKKGRWLFWLLTLLVVLALLCCGAYALWYIDMLPPEVDPVFKQVVDWFAQYNIVLPM